MKLNPYIRRRRRERRITLDWPDPPIAFQDILPTWEPKFPALMIPWGGGRQIIYNLDTEETYWRQTPPAWWVYPSTTTHLAGEEYRPGMTGIGFSFARFINIKFPGTDGIQIDTPLWLINDVYQPDRTAMQRSYALVNLGPQPEGVDIPQVVQVSDKANFNKYLQAFKDGGFIGALVRDLNDTYHDPQYGVVEALV